MFEELEARRARLDALRPFDAGASRRLERVLKPYFIYSSNALEGSTLSLGDTLYILEEGRLPGGKKEEEYLEVKGQEEAYRFLTQAVDGRFILDDKLVREFHQLLTGRLDHEKYQPGQYKTRDNRVDLGDGNIFPYVSHVEPPAAMAALISWARSAAGTLHAVELAARLHYNFILIHPFLDGNGRTARMLANLVLMQAGYVPAMFRAEDRRRVYLDALRGVDVSVAASDLAPLAPALNYFPFVSYLEEELLWSFDRALDAVTGKAGLTSEDIIKRFADLDGRARITVPQGEAERRRAQEAAVREMTGLIESAVSDLVDAGRQHLQATIASVTSSVDGHPPRGTVSLQVTLRSDADPSLWMNRQHLRFVVAAEPHRMIIGCQRGPAEPVEAQLQLPRSPDQWRRSEIQQFVVDRVASFLDGIEISLTS